MHCGVTPITIPVHTDASTHVSYVCMYYVCMSPAQTSNPFNVKLIQ